MGEGGTLLHFDGVAWSLVNEGFQEDLRDVGGSGADDVWVVGSGALISHFDGAVWQDRGVVGNRNISSVWANAPNDASGRWRYMAKK